MEKKVQIHRSFADAEKADKAYYLSLTPEERMDILLELVERGNRGAPPRIERVYRIITFDQYNAEK